MSRNSRMQEASKSVSASLRLAEERAGLSGVSTGISRLDHFVFGWLPSTVNVIEGDMRRRHPSQLLLRMAIFRAMAGIPVAFFSLDTSVRAVTLQMLEVVSGGPLQDHSASRDRLEEAAERMAGAPLARANDEMAFGDVPSVYQQPGPSKAARMIGDLLSDLVKNQRLNPGQIVILTPRTPRNSSLGEVDVLNGIPIVHSLDHRPDGVLHASIGAFKGLEADTVIMADIDPDDDRCNVNSRYVAASRACHRLYVFQKGNWQQTTDTPLEG